MYRHASACNDELSLIVLQSSFYLENSSVVDTNNRVKTIEKVSRQEFPFGYGVDGGGGNTVKLLESTVARFGPIASFRGTYRANRWSLHITPRNTYLPGNYVFECLSQLQLCKIEHVCVCVCVGSGGWVGVGGFGCVGGCGGVGVHVCGCGCVVFACLCVCVACQYI